MSSVVIFAVLGLATAFLWAEWRQARRELCDKSALITELSGKACQLEHQLLSQRVRRERAEQEAREAKQHAAALKIMEARHGEAAQKSS